ncbi:MAG: adenylate kinase [Clostridia bacterium]|nr:adenylate kinase [Clostridia bacterium]
MEKVIVIGCPGSGKSVFSAALSQKTGLPLCHLDMLYWNPDRTTVPREVFDDRLKSILDNDKWIIDGNYGRTMEIRMMAADTVFFLDYPTEVCIEGIYERRGKARPDIPWIEPEDEVDEEFLRSVKEYRDKSRPRVIELFEKYSYKSIIIFRDRIEADLYLKTL